MQTQLFIEDQEVELDKQVQFLLDKQYEDINNPTTIKNDCSKTISIPFTEKNNKLFGYIYKPERIITSNGNNSTGIYFDPQKKMNFVLKYNSTILMSGYAKMNSVNRKGNKGTYDITLFGELGNILSELSNYTFDPNGNPDYVIDASSLNFNMNRSTVYSRLTSFSTTQINFTLNNAFKKDFNYKTIQDAPNSTIEFKDLLNSENVLFETNTGVSLDSIIGNGLKPYDIGEFRSWCQLPYIYMTKLFDLMNTKLQARTGYSFEFDTYLVPQGPSQVTADYPFWSRMVYLLNSPLPVDETKYQNRYLVKHNEYTSGISTYNFTRNSNESSSQYTRTFEDTIQFHVDSQYSGYEQIPLVPYVSSQWYAGMIPTLDNYDYVLSNLQLLVYNQGDSAGNTWNDNTSLKLVIKVYNPSNSTVYSEETFYFCNEEVIDTLKQLLPDYNFIGVPKTVETESTVINGNTYYFNYWRLNIPNIYLSKYYGSNLGIKMTYNLQGDYIFSGNRTFYGLLGWNNAAARVTDNYVDITPNNKSFSDVTLNQLWDKSKSPYEVCVNFTKMFGLIWEVDEARKKIKIQTRKTYFNNYTIVDWTDKLDCSKEIKITPLMTENHYMLFNYNDIGTSISENYNKSTGFKIGEKRVNTNYPFNENTNELYKSIKNSNAYTANRLDYNKLFDCQISYYGTSTVFVDNADKDGNAIDTFGSYYFVGASKSVSNIKITDDNVFQKANRSLTYGGEKGAQINSSMSSSYNLTSYVPLSIVYTGNLPTAGTVKCLGLFNTPAKSYINGESFQDAVTIYDRFWNNYIQERYNLQNKQMTCYLRLTPKDWIDFKFNHFVKIDNVLYIVNHIYDYDITSSDSTKVDLITITDVNGYIS